MSSPRYEPYEPYRMYEPTGGAEAVTAVMGAPAAPPAPPVPDGLGEGAPPGAIGPSGVFGPPTTPWAAPGAYPEHAAHPGHAAYGGAWTYEADGPPAHTDHEAYAGHDAGTAHDGYDGRSGYSAPSGHPPHGSEQGFPGGVAYGSGQERHPGGVPYPPYGPYGGGTPESWRPVPPTPAAPPVPDVPPAPLHSASGVRRAGAVRVAPDAPTEPRLTRPQPDPEGTGTRSAPGVEGADPGAGRAGARRGARRRRVSERPDSLRRLLPQALVVAFLAGGTSAFVANDKAIELSVDGRPRTLHTFAGDVTELLADEGVKVGPHDMVAPAPGTALASGDEVAVRYGRPVHLTIDGERRRVWTTAHTVEGALSQLGVRAEGAYLSASRSRRIGREGLELHVRTERAVTVMADGRARTIRTNAASVAEAIQEAGVTLRGQDTTSVPAGSFPRDGQTVTVLRVTGSREVREERIPFEVRRADDASLFKGVEVVEHPGRYGARRLTYTLRTVNGVRQRPRLVGSEVVRQPQTRTVRVGTKPHPPAPGGADHLNWEGLAACESGGRPAAVDPSGTYGGLYQFDTHTWHKLGGTGRPQDAPAAEQTRRAKKLYVRRGTSPWPHCGPRLHG